MNILVVAHYQGDGSPCASFVHNQAKAYAALGHHVQIIVPVAAGKLGWDHRKFGPILNHMKIDGILYHFFRFVSFSRYGEPWLNGGNAKSVLSFYYSKIFETFRPDIIHAHTLGKDSLVGSYLKNRLHIPMVVTTHGSDTSVPFEQGKRKLLRSLCDRADCVVAVSSPLADKLRQCGTATPVQVIVNGFQSEHICAKRSKSPHSVIQVGNLIPSKRFSVTMDAFAGYYKRYPDATLTLIGQGPERDRLEEQCKSLGISQAVRFLGKLPNDMVLEEMAKHRFFVMPSVREGFGIVYLEAMASGCITVGTAGEGISDFIRHGENGYLVPPDTPAAITEILINCSKHPEKEDALTQQGRINALQQTWKKNAEENISLFQYLTRNEV